MPVIQTEVAEGGAAHKMGRACLRIGVIHDERASKAVAGPVDHHLTHLVRSISDDYHSGSRRRFTNAMHSGLRDCDSSWLTDASRHRGPHRAADSQAQRKAHPESGDVS